MGWGKLITKTVKGSGRILGGGLKYGSGAFGMYASGNAIYQYAANDKGALDTWGNMFLGKDTMNKVKTEGAGEVVGDFFLGEGNTDKVIEKGKDLIEQANQKIDEISKNENVQNAVGTVRETLDKVGDYIDDFFSRPEVQEAVNKAKAAGADLTVSVIDKIQAWINSDNNNKGDGE